MKTLMELWHAFALPSIFLTTIFGIRFVARTLAWYWMIRHPVMREWLFSQKEWVVWLDSLKDDRTNLTNTIFLSWCWNVFSSK